MLQEVAGDDMATAPGDSPLEQFADLYRRQLRPMVRLAYLLTGGSPAAEELVQESFLAVHRRWDSIQQPSAYLRQVVVHRAASHRRRAALEARKAPAPPPSSVEQPVDELRDAIAALPPRQRAAIVLRYYEDLPEADIAAAMACGVPAVKSLLHRGLRELRKVVEP